MSENFHGRVADATGLLPPAEPQSVSGHSPCDPSRIPWQPIATAPKGKKAILLIAPYPGGHAWSDPYAGWWDAGLRQPWFRWPHTFPPTHWAPITVPGASQGIEARSAETSGSAEGESPVGREADAPVKSTQTDEVRA